MLFLALIGGAVGLLFGIWMNKYIHGHWVMPIIFYIGYPLMGAYLALIAWFGVLRNFKR